MAKTLVQRSLARDLIAALNRVPAGTPALPELVPQLLALLGADQASAFLVRSDGPVRRLDFFYGAHMPAGIKPAYERWLMQAPKKFAAYDPDLPDPRQRNVALSTSDLTKLTGISSPPVTRSFLPRFALSESDQLRVLVCDGPLLLAWVGAFRAKPFSRREKRLLAALTPALQQRLALERRLAEAQTHATEIGATLEEVPAAAFVLGSADVVLHANAAGRALLDRDRGETEGRLAAVRKGNQPGAQVARLSADGELRLVILRTPSDPSPMVDVARARWHLTPRQAQVLALLARGLSNRALAASLSCAESTVELHVTALLEKSGCESRAHLVARLWSGV